MSDAPTPSPRNQRRRTRKDLLTAAADLLGAGGAPTMDEVAEAALVSRATAYRYFPNIESLLVEAPLDSEVSDPQVLFADDDSSDPVQRLDKAESALHDMVYRNELGLRTMLAMSLRLDEENRPRKDTPVRQNRRMDLIEEAVAPARDRFDAAAYERLCAALCLLFGLESMIVFRDVLCVGEDEARAIKSWAIRALVGAALSESASESV